MNVSPVMLRASSNVGFQRKPKQETPPDIQGFDKVATEILEKAEWRETHEGEFTKCATGKINGGRITAMEYGKGSTGNVSSTGRTVTVQGPDGILTYSWFKRSDT